MTNPIRRIGKFCTLALTLSLTALAVAQATPAALNPMQSISGHRPLEIGALVQGGFGVTENRGDFKYFMAGAQAGKVLTGNHGSGLLRGNFEYGVQLFPFWQSYTPKFQRELCPAPGGPCSMRSGGVELSSDKG